LESLPPKKPDEGGRWWTAAPSTINVSNPLKGGMPIKAFCKGVFAGTKRSR